jgi:hypothetical protein
LRVFCLPCPHLLGHDRRFCGAKNFDPFQQNNDCFFRTKNPMTNDAVCEHRPQFAVGTFKCELSTCVTLLQKY